jgi:hypothetical protein
MPNVNLIQTVARVGRRLAEAGREARAASKSVAGPAADQVTEVLGAAVGEVVRAAVIGAVAAAVRGATTATPRPAVAPAYDPWGDDEFPSAETDSADVPLPTAKPAWAKATRAVGSALGVAAGAAAAVPGGKLVAAGLGVLAAVAGLAARAAEPTA